LRAGERLAGSLGGRGERIPCARADAGAGVGKRSARPAARSAVPGDVSHSSVRPFLAWL